MRYKSMSKEGKKIVLHFHPMGGPEGSENALKTKSYPEWNLLKGFVIAGPDRKFYPAEAKCVESTVEVWSDQVPNPVAVRYAWATWPEGNLVWNIGNLPASPFRTDDWPLFEDAPFDGRSKESQEWRDRKLKLQNEARKTAQERRANEARKTIETLSGKKK